MRRADQVLMFDADNTLWENNVLFERVIEGFMDWIVHPAMDRGGVRAVLNDIERANVARHGYGTGSFVRSLVDCVEHLAGRPPTARERARIAELAAVLAREEVELIPGVELTLAALAARHRLLLVTKGDLIEQQRKIDASGLAGNFEAVHVVAEKDEATYRRLVAETRLDPTTTWMIGNSPRSDVVAARRAGLRAVFLPHPHTWVLEHDEVDPADDGVLHLARFPDLLDHF